MKILSINSSPRTGGESKTELMLNYLVEGMQEAGAEVEVVNLREKKIKYCIGCFTCWTKTPGNCIHKDDMTKELFPKCSISRTRAFTFHVLRDTYLIFSFFHLGKIIERKTSQLSLSHLACSKPHSIRPPRHISQLLTFFI